jgi:hypothetical protein
MFRLSLSQCLSVFMIYYRICNKSTTISGAWPYHFRAPELLTISNRPRFLPFQSAWATYHFRAPELLTISEHLSFLPFQSAWASCHFRAPELLTISERLSFLPFQSAWASYHFRAPESHAISERLSFLLFQSAWAQPRFKWGSCCSNFICLCSDLSTNVYWFVIFRFGHCIFCRSLTYIFWLSIWHLITFDKNRTVTLRSQIHVHVLISYFDWLINSYLYKIMPSHKLNQISHLLNCLNICMHMF